MAAVRPAGSLLLLFASLACAGNCGPSAEEQGFVLEHHPENWNRFRAERIYLEPLFWSLSLQNKVLYGLDLSYATFYGGELKNITFLQCDLSNSDFTGARLEGVRFIGSNLDLATFHNASLYDVEFARSSAIGLRFYRGRADKVRLIECDLTGMKAAFGRWRRCRLEGCNLRDAYERNTNNLLTCETDRNYNCPRFMSSLCI